MSLNHYKMYIDQIFELAETIVIKSELTAQAINKKLILQHGVQAVNPNDKTTWKYYLNLAGKYHPTDTKIIITSLDDLSQIVFDAQTLKNHTATAKAYEYGSRYYRELVSQYPADYEILILGVLYPIDINYAINADDFSVIGYPAKYVEANEASLINNINKWLRNFKTRWFNVQYTMSDNLYLASTLAVMYQHLVPLIIDLRLRACKTNEAHSYHIREYLSSHGMLDEYLDFMTKKQALFFYRNIAFIERNSGKTETFNWLLDKVLTQRDIPVTEISLSQDYSEILNDFKPKPRFVKTNINVTNSNATSASAFYTLNELLSKEANEAAGNSDYIRNNLEQIQNKILRSKTSFLKTKVLESSMVDYTDAGLYSIQDIALDHWCYMSVSNQYRAVINFNDTFTGQDLSLPNHVAFLYFLYAYCQAFEIPVRLIPEFYVTRVAIDPVPTIEDLQKVVSKKYIPVETLHYLRSLHTPLQTIISTSSFHEFLIKTHISYKAQNMLAVTQNGLNERAMVKNATYRLYKTARVQSPYIGQSFESVLKDFGLRTTSVTKDEWINIYSTIYTKATGLDINQTESKAAMQQAMISLFKKLSSYSIQFLSDINKTTIRSINWSAIRLGNLSHYGKDLRHIKLVVFKLFNKLSTSSDYKFIEIKSLLQKFYIQTRYNIGFFDITFNSWQVPPVVSKRININRIKLNNDNYTTKDLLFKDLPEFKSFYNLLEQQQKNTKDIYRDWVTDADFIPKLDIDNEPRIPKVLRTDFMYPSILSMDSFNYKLVNIAFDFRVDINSLELDAFYSNFGSISSKAFRPFIKFHKNDRSFKLAPGKEQMNAPSFKYTGGIRYNPGFGFSRDLALDADFGDFVLIMNDPTTLPDLVPEFETRIINFFFNTLYSGINLGNLKLNSSKTQLDQLNLDTNISEINPGRLVAGSGEVDDLVFVRNGRNILNFSFDGNLQDLQDFSIDSGSFTLGNFDIATGTTRFTMKLNYGITDLKSLKIVNTQNTISFNTIINQAETIKNFYLRTGIGDLGSYKTHYLINQLNNFNYVLTDSDLEKYRWSGADINNFINWPDNFVETDFEIESNYPINSFDVILTIEQGEALVDNIEIITEELGTAEYSSVDKQINFN